MPIILLSAKRDLIDKSLGFKLGADDYITKPFEPAELVMRVNSCLRRSQAFAEKSEEPMATEARRSSWVIYPSIPKRGK